MRATFFFNLYCNIIALQVETLCSLYYQVCWQLISQQIQACRILHVKLVNHVEKFREKQACSPARTSTLVRIVHMGIGLCTGRKCSYKSHRTQDIRHFLISSKTNPYSRADYCRPCTSPKLQFSYHEPSTT